MNNFNVLFVDDDDNVLNSIKRVFLMDDDINVITAGSGEEAMELINSNEIDLVISDEVMPKMRGSELLKLIKEKNPEILRIILTGFSDIDTVIESINSSEVYRYLTKPWNDKDLRMAVRKALEYVMLIKNNEGMTEKIKNQNKELVKINSELKDTIINLEHMQSRLLQADKMASIGQLAAGIAHEINNPIGFVKSNLSIMVDYMEKIIKYIKKDKRSSSKKAAGGESQMDYIIKDIGPLLNESLEGIKRVEMIVKNLRDFSHIDTRNVEYKNINQMVDDTINLLWNELKYKVKIQKNYGELPLVKCFPQQIIQVFLNIINNALQAIEEKGIIKIYTFVEDDHVVITIEDNGKGIPEDKLLRIFDPFFTTKDVGVGTGLGLSIVYDIIKKHKGDITVESQLNIGTIFTITLKIEPEPDKDKINGKDYI